MTVDTCPIETGSDEWDDTDGVEPEPEGIPEPRPTRTPMEAGRRRYTVAVLVGMGITVPLVLWILWDLWNGSVNPLRAVPYDDFYDLQARSMFAGHLWIPTGRMGIEAFNHAGRQYTYFGIFPSLLRMPVLLVTHRLDGRLTAPSILLAWCATALTSALLFWRLRILMRGEAVVGRAEAASYGALMATVMGGSVVLYLAATPFIYNEDFAWSVPLTIGSLFALLGVLEHASWRRVVTSGALVLATSLNRTPTGYACIIAAGLVGVWFAAGRAGRSERRWALPMLGVAVIAFVANAAVTYAKFGIPVGLPMADQVWASVNAHRRYFLAANGGKAFSPAFLPSTLWAYLDPLGLKVSGLFPFITPPTAPAAALNGAVLDQTYPTASITTTMPLLFVAACWGLVTAFRPRGLGKVRLTRIPLIGGALGAGGVLLWGYISERYMADIVPFLVLAAGIGMVDLWHRLATRPTRIRTGALAVVVAATTYCVVANVAIAIAPVGQWSNQQNLNFVTAQRNLSLTSLGSQVRTGSTLPYWAPAGQLFAVNHCSGLYLSTGNSLKDVPGQQDQHFTWMPVEQSADFMSTIGFTFNRPAHFLTRQVLLMTYGASRLVMQPAGGNYVRFDILNSGTRIAWPASYSWRVPIHLLHEEYRINAVTDPNLNSIEADWYGEKLIGHYLAGDSPPVITPTPAPVPGQGLPVVTVAAAPNPPGPTMALCRSLTSGH